MDQIVVLRDHGVSSLSSSRDGKRCWLHVCDGMSYKRDHASSVFENSGERVVAYALEWKALAKKDTVVNDTVAQSVISSCFRVGVRCCRRPFSCCFLRRRSVLPSPLTLIDANRTLTQR